MHDCAAGIFIHCRIPEFLPGSHVVTRMRSVHNITGCAPVLRYSVDFTVVATLGRELGVVRRGVIVGYTRQIDFLDQIKISVGRDCVVRRNEYIPPSATGL